MAAAAAAAPVFVGPDPEWRRIEGEAADFAQNRPTRGNLAALEWVQNAQVVPWRVAFRAYVRNTYPAMFDRYAPEFTEFGALTSLLYVSDFLAEVMHPGFMASAVERATRSFEANPQGRLLAKEIAIARAGVVKQQQERVSDALFALRPIRGGLDWDERQLPVDGALQYVVNRVPAAIVDQAIELIAVRGRRSPIHEVAAIEIRRTIDRFNQERRLAQERTRIAQSRVIDHIAQGGASTGGGQLIAHHVNRLLFGDNPLRLRPLISREQLARELNYLRAEVAAPSAAAALPDERIRARIQELIDLLDGRARNTEQ